MKQKKFKSCVYFFKHIGLDPIKIGYSENESPINRFNAFKTYAPFGAELIGFIPTEEAKKLETELHRRYSDKRLEGEWFNISVDEVEKIINMYSTQEEVERRNNFQIAYSKVIFEKRNVKEIKLKEIKPKIRPNELRELIEGLYDDGKLILDGEIINISELAREYGTNRMAIYRIMERLK